MARFGGLAIGPAFLLLGLWFLLGLPRSIPPSAATPVFDRALLAPVPRRTALGDPPLVLIAGYEQNCNSCHRLFQSTWDGTRPRTQHTEIHLQHGFNNQCMNCHAKEDRERLALNDGTTVPFADVAILCAQCHGPIYNDWTRGVHGKTLGYWNASLGPRRRLVCTECHDPHHPAYDPIAPLPGPHTLRMGEPSEHHHSAIEAERNPLRMWSLDLPGHGEPAETHPESESEQPEQPEQPPAEPSPEEGATK
jgi:hypothetical protein